MRAKAIKEIEERKCVIDLTIHFVFIEPGRQMKRSKFRELSLSSGHFLINDLMIWKSYYLLVII